MRNKVVNWIIKITSILAIVLGIIFGFFIFSNADQGNAELDKNQEQIKYLDTKILALLNYLNNIDLQNYKIVQSKVEAETDPSSSSSKEDEKSSEKVDSSENGTGKEEKTLTKMEEETMVNNDEDIDWQTIEGEAEILYSTWPSIVLDLYKININQADILAFSDTLDEAVLNIKKKDKALSAMYLAKLYGYLPLFLDRNEVDEIKLKNLEAKTYIINAYAYGQTENWDKMKEEVIKAESIYTNLVNDARFVNDKRKYNVDKAYILIEELKLSLDTKNIDIFYVKYKNTLEELNVLN